MFTSCVKYNKKKVSLCYYCGQEVLDFLSIPPKNKALSIDLETYGEDALVPKKAKIRTLQLWGTEDKKAHILDFKSIEDIGQSKELFTKLDTFLRTANRLIAHNAIFETAFLKYYLKKYVDKVYAPLGIHCTQNMYRLSLFAEYDDLNENDKKSNLKIVSQKILNFTPDKDEQQSDWGVDALSPEQLEYCALDALLPYLIYNKLYTKIKNYGMLKLLDLNTKAQEAVAHTKIHGFKLDTIEHNKLIKTWDKERQERENICILAMSKHVRKMTTGSLEDALLRKVVVKEQARVAKLLVSLRGQHSEKTVFKDMLAFEKRIEKIVKAKKDITDKEALKKYNSAERALKRVVKNIKELLVFPKSSKQKSEFFEQNYKDVIRHINWERSEKSGQLKVDKEHLKAIQDLVPEAKLINEFQEFEKLISTYGIGLKKFVDEDGIIYPNYTLCKTTTGRMSSYKPNSQNFVSDPKIRRLFIPRTKERKILCADFSQIEIRIAALFSQDETMLDAYNTGKDIHRITAAGLLNKPEHLVSKQERQDLKPIGFLIIYGGGAKSMAKKLGISVEQAEKYIEGYLETYDGFADYRRKQIRRAKKDLYIKTKIGKYVSLNDKNFYTCSINYPIQGSAGEVMLYALYYLWVCINKTGIDATICNVVHDEVIVDCAVKDIPRCKVFIKKSMEKAMTTVFPEASIRDLVEVGVGDNWSEAK